MKNKTKTEKKVELVRGILLSSEWMKLVDDDTFKSKYWEVKIKDKDFEFKKLDGSKTYKFYEKEIQSISFDNETISFKLFKSKDPINIDF